MKKYRFIAVIGVMAVMCSCSEQRIDDLSAPETSVSISETAAQETTADIITVTFAETEADISEAAVTEAALPETELTEAEIKENQIEYRDKNVRVLMEFTGAEELNYYPKAAAMASYRDDHYVLHSYFTVENLSKKSFDFIPQKMIIYGRHDRVSWYMLPITQDNTGLEASDGYYTVESGEKVSFNVDFVGEKDCIEYANEIKYVYELKCGMQNVDHTTLNNVEAAGNIHLDNRFAVKKAVSAALAVQEENKTAPLPLTPSDGEYSVTTPKNSYCFTAESINDGSFVKVALRLQCLTGEAEVFEPNMFRLTRKGGKDCFPNYWGFDRELVDRLPDEYEIKGVSEKLYGNPIKLYIRPDGTAEYDMYFFTGNEDAEDYYMFSYDGENDVFESLINLKQNEGNALAGKWTEQNRLYTYEFDDSGNVTIDTLSCRVSGRYELSGKYDLILYLEPQGENEGDEPVPFGFDLKKTDNGYEMDYHPMDEHGSLPFEPTGLVTGYYSALWTSEPIVLTEYKETEAVEQKDVLGLWKNIYDDVILFTEDNIYSIGRRGLMPADAFIKKGSFDNNGEKAYVSKDGERLVISTLYGTEVMTRWTSDNSSITGLYMFEGEGESAELWMKNGSGIVYSDSSGTAASVSIDGADITIKMGDKIISGVFCPLVKELSDEDKFGYYKDGGLPCDYYLLTENGSALLRFNSLTFYDLRFNEWYNSTK